MELPKLISIHVPKTGGVTFFYVLNKIYGKNAYNDPTMSPLNPFFTKKHYIDNYAIYSAIHGHFDYTKYQHLGRPLITWVRDPIDRVISHYLYWKYKRYDTKNQFYHKIMKNMNLNIYQFAELMPNCMTTLTGEDPSIYSFIGKTEDFDNSLNRFFKIFNLPKVECTRKNTNNRKPKTFEVDTEKLVPFLRKDIKFYREACKLYGI